MLMDLNEALSLRSAVHHSPMSEMTLARTENSRAPSLAHLQILKRSRKLYEILLFFAVGPIIMDTNTMPDTPGGCFGWTL